MRVRDFDRSADQLRPITITPDYIRHADGSVLIEMGNTKVICAVTMENKVPGWMSGTGKGWLTAEYSLLPFSTNRRSTREAIRGKQSGRTLEIQRLIGRALRASIDMKNIGDRTFTVDCDVIQADGGTRTAAITGGFVALSLALKKLIKLGLITEQPLLRQVCAVSCGIVDGMPLLDIDYEEDHDAWVDMNFVMTADGDYIELQGTAEDGVFSQDDLETLKALAKTGIEQLARAQRDVIGDDFETLINRNGK